MQREKFLETCPKIEGKHFNSSTQSISPTRIRTNSQVSLLLKAKATMIFVFDSGTITRVYTADEDFLPTLNFADGSSKIYSPAVDTWFTSQNLQYSLEFWNSLNYYAGTDYYYVNSTGVVVDSSDLDAMPVEVDVYNYVPPVAASTMSSPTSIGTMTLCFTTRTFTTTTFLRRKKPTTVWSSTSTTARKPLSNTTELFRRRFT